MRPPNYFASGALDRLGARRIDETWLTEAARATGARVTLVWRSRSLVSVGEETRAGHIALAGLGDDAPAIEERELVFLGVHEGEPRFALDISTLDEPHRELRLDESLAFEDLRKVGPLLDRDDGSLLAYARAMATWHARHRYCGSCGAATESLQGGHLRRCTGAECRAEIFPRTDPAVIMLVHDGGDRCLLGRQASWPAGVYSTLAGFVEPGESLEDAVRREVEEEAGIAVTASTYHSSQPWPFPSSIMLGFWALAPFAEVSVDGSELEEARWLDRRQILDREVRLPPPMSIARRLIDDWLREG